MNVHLRQLEEERQTKAEISKRKEIIKIAAETNDVETNKTIKINETKGWFLKISTKLIKL